METNGCNPQLCELVLISSAYLCRVETRRDLVERVGELDISDVSSEIQEKVRVLLEENSLFEEDSVVVNEIIDEFNLIRKDKYIVFKMASCFLSKQILNSEILAIDGCNKLRDLANSSEFKIDRLIEFISLSDDWEVKEYRQDVELNILKSCSDLLNDWYCH
jgi:hypothetical protein